MKTYLFIETSVEDARQLELQQIKKEVRIESSAKNEERAIFCVSSVIYNRTEFLMFLERFITATYTYDEYLAEGKKIYPDGIETPDGTEEFDFQISAYHKRALEIYGGVDIDGEKITSTTNDMLKVLAGYIIIKDGIKAEVDIPKDDGTFLKMNNGNKGNVLMSVFDHVDNKQKGS